MEGLAKSLADEQDKYLRLAAEYDNYRKRTAKEKESLYADAKIDTIKALLGVYDNLERGLAQYGDEESPHRKGLEMVFNQFKESLKKLGVETMDAAGKPFDPEKTNWLLPVDKYIGGAEHACMHLLYARFFTMALHDMGYLNFDEPFRSLVHQGVILGPDGERMSKSRGNVISPDEYIQKYGSDVFRMNLGFGFSYVEG